MLENTGKKPPRKNDSDAPAPWLMKNQVKKAQGQKNISQALQLLTETHPLISPAGCPEAPRLTTHQPTSEEILLEDELKLKTIASSLLKQLEQAFALIYWVKTTKQSNSNWQISSS